MNDAGFQFPELRALWPRVNEIMADEERQPGAAAVGRVVCAAIGAAVVSRPGLTEAEVKPLMQAALARLAQVEPECAACALVHLMNSGVKELAREVIAEDTATAAAAALAEVVLRFGRGRGT